MAYTKANLIFEEISDLIKNRITLAKENPLDPANLPKVNFSKEVENIPQFLLDLKQRTHQLLELYREEPLVQDVILQLFSLTQHLILSIKEIHDETKMSLQVDIRTDVDRRDYLFSLLYGFVEYDNYLKIYLIPMHMGHVPTPENAEKPSQQVPVVQIIIQTGHSGTVPRDKARSEKHLPQFIALLHVLGFLDHPAFRDKPKSLLRDIIRYFIGFSDRQIKGNILVMDPDSKEDRTRYTAAEYIPWAKKVLNGQVKLFEMDEAS